MFEVPGNQSEPSEFRIVILAGGKSRRMGRRKDLLALGGQTLTEWVRGSLLASGFPVSVLRYDLVPGLGPLGGIWTACAAYSEPWFVFVGCDMPFVNRDLVDPLVWLTRESGRAAVSAVGDRWGFPLAFCRSDVAMVWQQLRLGRRSLGGLMREVGAEVAEIPELLEWRTFNVNTPEDWERARVLGQEKGLLA
jgi:molybdenum cofactor guanylyltransferase